MKHLAHILLPLLLLLAAPLPAGDKLKLTLDEAKAIALKNNPTLARAKASIEAARAAIEQATAAYYPSVDLSAGATRLRDYPTRPNRDYDNTTQYSLGLSASWLIYNGGAREFSYLIAKAGGETALQEHADARRTLLENVSYAFYIVVQSQNAMDIAKQDAEFNRQLLEDSKKKLDLGVAKQSEVLNFKYQVEKAEINYISSEETWRNACIALGQLLVIEQESIWDAIELAPATADPAKVPPADVKAMLHYAAEHRPDLKQAEQEVLRAEYGVSLARSTWQPTVSAFYNYDFQRTHSAHFNTHYDRGVTFGVSASWNIFGGGATTAAVSAAQAQLDAAREALNAIRLAVNANVRECCIRLETNRRTLEKQIQLHEIAKQIRDLVHEEYLGGTATITRLNEVQTDLTNAANAKSIAEVSLLNSIERLAAATGQNLQAK